MDDENPRRRRSDASATAAVSRISSINFNGVYRRLDTNSSGSVRESRYYLQLAGAEARERLLLAAAEMWNVPAAELTAKDSVITHAASGRRTTLWRDRRQGRPDQATRSFEDQDQGTGPVLLIGTEQKNRDVPLKVTGKAVYGIDVDLPGMLYAAVKACPVFGGKLKSYDFAAVKNRPGVHSAVAIEGKGPRTDSDFGTSGQEYRYAAVAVVADTWWRAKTALDLMSVEWDVGDDGHVTTRRSLPRRLRDAEKVRHRRAGGGRQLRRRQGEGRQGGRGDLHGSVTSPMPAWSRATPPPW